MSNPIKRNEALKPLSRDHHHGLLLCWKIRQGIKLNIEPERIKKVFGLVLDELFKATF